MKAFIVLLAAVSLFLGSCTKDHRNDCVDGDKFSLDGAVVISKGSLVFNTLTKTNGVAKVYLQKNGKYIVGLEQVNVHSTYELVVYLSKAATKSATSIQLFSFRTLQGERYYEMPAAINPTLFDHLVIQGDQTTVPEAVAILE